MNLLILGGTRFLGRHVADALLARGHSVTLFNRGITDASTRDGLAQIHGDRERDLRLLGDVTWDAAIDTSCYHPRTAQIAARYFAERTRRYIFISTISVYDHAAATALTEDSPIQLQPRGEYGPDKARCEAIMRSTFRRRGTIVRPGLIVGPYDPTDRFTYWPLRIAAGGDVVAPVSPGEPTQFIDVRDLSAFIVQLLERDDCGTYNATSPPARFTIGEVLDTCARIANSRPRIHWLSEAALLEQDVAPWMDLPLWINEKNEARSILNAAVRRAEFRGLHIRPLDQTVRDTLAWARAAGKRWGALQAGLSRQREAQLLAR